MRLLRGAAGSVSSFLSRRFAAQTINFESNFNVSAMAISTAWIIWKILIWLTGIQSPVTVVISGSMEPGFRRGDILLLHMNDAPIRAGEIVLFNLEGRDIPIIHRVIKVHEHADTGEIKILTKGDNNREDDTYGIYADGHVWLQRNDIIGRAAGYLPYLGWATIILKEYRIIKILLSGAFIWQAITVSVDAD
ncbi:uncharacterized protein [Aristolochia californica]|uniref:uncharacterized protein n=1 Tax=Aristolochia californica TaxID=171875 RepID=UPI0035E05F62